MKIKLYNTISFNYCKLKLTHNSEVPNSQHSQQVVKDLRNYEPVKTYASTGFVLQNLKN